jgi:excisionase family DNA binding protein
MIDSENKGVEKLLSRQEAAEILGVKTSTLAVWASTKRYDLPHIKVGRLTKYKTQDVKNFIERHTSNSLIKGGY